MLFRLALYEFTYARWPEDKARARRLWKLAQLANYRGIR